MTARTNRTNWACRTAAVAALLLGLAGCTNAEDQGQACSSDSQCSGGQHCIGGKCGGCTADAGCPTGQTCNQAGFCQASLGCTDSIDCPSGTFCDTTTGNCIDAAHCTEDIQCPLGQVCDNISFTCVDGCREVGDCPFGDVCQCPAGQTCASGAILSCITGPCGDNSYCQYGQICEAEVDGGPKSCEEDTRGPFCQPCTFTPGAPSFCGDGTTPNFCLVDTSVTFSADFCGVDCSEGQACPNGFECSDVLVLTEQTCGSSGMQCPLRTAPTCNSDTDCTNARGGSCNTTTHTCVCVTDTDCPGGECDPVSGQCRSSCITNEGDPQGFCTCLEDTDCPQDTCDSQNQACAIQATSCDPTVANSCLQIFCKKVSDPLSGSITGYCYIGQNCAPEDGVSCSQVLNSQ